MASVSMLCDHCFRGAETSLKSQLGHRAQHLPAGQPASCIADNATAFRLMLAHYADASLLLVATSVSSAVVPAVASRRLLAVAAPEVAGALSTTVVSGEM